MSTKKLQIVGSVVSTDTTLTQSGVAADAKAVGDAIVASNKVFYVTVTEADGVYTSDKTEDEIIDAYNNGKAVFCVVFINEAPNILNLITINNATSSTIILFASTVGARSVQVTFNSGNIMCIVSSLNNHQLLSNTNAPNSHTIGAITGLEDALAGKQPVGDYILESELQNSIDTALAQAKESGEFDGTSVTHSWDGTTLTVTSASGTSFADLKGEQGVSGVYVGSGDMPEGYNVQIDPTGDADLFTGEGVSF